jgi:hypothetical protein
METRMSALNPNQRNALRLVASRGTACAYAHATDADTHTAWLHYRTAESLERLGLVTIARADEWDIELTEAGTKLAAETPS